MPLPVKNNCEPLWSEDVTEVVEELYKWYVVCEFILKHIEIRKAKHFFMMLHIFSGSKNYLTKRISQKTMLINFYIPVISM